VVEAAGMVPQLARVADDYGVDVYSGGGFSSLNAIYEAAERISGRAVGTTVLVVGDLDPSGLSIADAAAADVQAFVESDVRTLLRFKRIAVTAEQVARFALPTAPQKPMDRRSHDMAATVQAEALAPPDLAAEVRASIEAELDLDVLEATKAEGGAERDEILAKLDGLVD
jgi:hypothetical protein